MAECQRHSLLSMDIHKWVVRDARMYDIMVHMDEGTLCCACDNDAPTQSFGLKNKENHLTDLLNQCLNCCICNIMVCPLLMILFGKVLS